SLLLVVLFRLLLPCIVGIPLSQLLMIPILLLLKLLPFFVLFLLKLLLLLLIFLIRLRVTCVCRSGAFRWRKIFGVVRRRRAFVIVFASRWRGFMIRSARVIARLSRVTISGRMIGSSGLSSSNSFIAMKSSRPDGRRDWRLALV